MSENYTVLDIFDNETYAARVLWTRGNCTPEDVVYTVIVTDWVSQKTRTYITKLTETTQYFNQGINYTISVRAQFCNGNLTSEESNKIYVFEPLAGKFIACTIIISAQ